MRLRCVVLAWLLHAVAGCTLSSDATSAVYMYSIRYTGARVPDIRMCKVIHWDDNTDLEDTVLGYDFMYEPMITNGVKASLMNEPLTLSYGLLFGDKFAFSPENFNFNFAEICRDLCVDNPNPTLDDQERMGRFSGGFDEWRIQEQARLAAWGYVYEQTFGTNDVMHITPQNIRQTLPNSGRWPIYCFSEHVVVRGYDFYNYEGQKFAEVKVNLPKSGFFTEYDHYKGVHAAQLAMAKALGEFLKRGDRPKIMRGRIEWSLNGTNEVWTVTGPDPVKD